MNEHGSEHVFNHQTIGPIRGIRKVTGVTQYLGVQYATLRDRFARGDLLEVYHPNIQRGCDGGLDATRVGPIPLSPSNGCQWEQLLIQHDLPFQEFQQSDTECLTLNIAVPEEGKRNQMPVLALVHGGAYATGSSSYPQYDLARIAQMSLEIGKPMIVVGINYRLGVPGFLYSSAMEAAGYKPNNGLHDQRLALLWIKHHILGFGGNPDRVTYIGESSGAASGCFHLHSTEPLFHQMIGMSGNYMLQAKEPESMEKAFGMAAELLGAGKLSPADQVKRLLEVPMENMRDSIGRRIPLGPMVDGDIIPHLTTFASLADGAEIENLFPGREWCKRIMMGDCQMDGSAYATRIAARSDILPATLSACLSKTLDPIDTALAPSIASAYGIDSSVSENAPESLKNVLDFATDICFALGARSFARAWSGASEKGSEAYLYHFNAPNPWEGPWKGHATHILDIAFVFQNYQEYLPQGQQKCATRFTRDVIAFVSGEKPWGAYRVGVEESSMVYYAQEQGYENESCYVSDEAMERTGRRDVLQKLLDAEGLGKATVAWMMFMKGPKQ